jgi:predicted DNA-binding transcriptional regulator AlpA
MQRQRQAVTEQLVSPAELAEMLGVSRQWAAVLVKRRDFPDPVVSGGPRWLRSEVQRYLQGHSPQRGRRVPTREGELTVSQAARETGLDRTYISRLCRDGTLPSRLVGNAHVILEQPFRDWLRLHSRTRTAALRKGELSVGQAAERAGTSRGYLRLLCRTGALPCRETSGGYAIEEAGFERWRKERGKAV